MFWKFELHPNSAIDTMLTREVSWSCILKLKIQRFQTVELILYFPTRFLLSYANFIFTRTVLWAKFWMKMTCCKKRNHKIGS